jgi:hypothetical protein
MQDSTSGRAEHGRPANPLLDFATGLAEMQLKYWEAYQLEGAAFVAKRTRANLEFLRALGHCADAQALGDCYWRWHADARKDYAEEMARLMAATFALGISQFAPMSSVFSSGKPKTSNGLDQTTHAPGGRAPL